ncbi:MAG: FliH/SctL family protein [Gemmatimonadaceae bacterium]
MTWSPSAPRGVPRPDRSPLPAPVSWAPDELALDTSSLHAALSDQHEHESVHNESPAVDPRELERALENAFERGYEEGRRAGELAEEERLRSAVSTANEAIASVHEESERWLGNIEANISALAIAVARQVIGQEIASDKSSLGDMVRQALSEFPLDQPLVVRVNPSDLRPITESLAATDEPMTPRAEMQWLADARIASGGCLIEGRDRIVDGRVDTALERLYRRLTYTGA